MTQAVRAGRVGGLASPALLGVAGLAVFAGLLELAPRLGWVDERFLPPLSGMLAALGEQVRRPEFWVAVLDTLIQWGIGLGLAVAAGLVVGVVIGSVPALRAVTASTIEFLRPIPSVALIPLAVLLYGSGIRGTLLLVVYASFWQVLVQVLHGVVDVDPVARDTARSYRLTTPARIWYLVLPTALPYITTGVRLATSVALVLTITGELIIGTPGLGQSIAVAKESNAVPQVYALVLVTGVIGLVVNLFFRFLERLMLTWHPAFRAVETRW